VSEPTDPSAQLYQVFIRASPQRLWAAITEPDLTTEYFHGARITNTPDRHVSYGPDGSLWGDGPVLEWDPPRAGWCTSGARCTTRSWPASSRAG
jgi:uncharacterized protein YndB with AHSA1/START domain